ncbi:MAG: class I SAM-dependent methyltransferase [Acidobacteriota bacterium]
MPKINAFDSFPDEYDAWFDNESSIYDLELKVIKNMLPQKGKGIEIGSGTGRFSLPIGIKIGVEPSHPMGVIAAGKGLGVIGGIAESLPVKSESFDFVLYNTVICFFDSLRLAFLESYRVLRPGGNVIVGFIDRESYLGDIYNREKDKSRFFKDAGFYSVPEISSILNTSGYHSLEYAQTLIFDKSNKTLSDKISNGYGEGSYVTVKGYKK